MSATDTTGAGGTSSGANRPDPDPTGRRALRRRRARSIAGTLLSLALTLVGLLLVTFIIGRVMPIDPVLKVVGDRASQAQYDAAYQAMGLDRPLYVQFARYLGDVLTGDLGGTATPQQAAEAVVAGLDL